MRLIPITCLTFLCLAARAADAPFPGKLTQWQGHDRYDFDFNGKPATVVAPKQALPGRPWAWRGEFFGAFANADAELVKRGFHLAYLRVPDLFGAPEAQKQWLPFYLELTGKYGLSKKPALIGMSRGGLYCFNWAAAHPDKVSCIWADAAVCDFKSWPGGKGSGKGSAKDWASLIKLYGFKDEAEALAYTASPIDRLEPLAKAKVAIIHVVGDADDVVPPAENTAIIEKRYKALGGEVELIHKAGGGHHPHGLDDPAPVVEFILKHSR